MAARATTARRQRARSATGRARRPNLDRYYARQLESIDPGEFEFQLHLLRGAGTHSLPLDTFTESFDWNDEESMMTGSLQLRRPEPQADEQLPIGRGHRVRCRVRWGGSWYELWTMRCASPEVTVETGQVTVELKDDLDIVRRSRRRFVFRRTKRRRYGWFGHHALRVAAREEGVALGAVAKCRFRMGKIDVRGSLLDLALAIYRHEHKKTGRQFVLRMRDGRFEVVPYKRNRTLYVLSPQLRSATVTQEPHTERPPTVLTGKARIGKGHAAHTIRHTEFRRDMVSRFGYAHRHRDYGHLDSHGQLVARVRRDLARYYKVDTTATVQSQGIPFIRRGDGAQLLLESEGFRGARSFVFVSSARHSVAAGSYTSEFTVTRDDPFDKARRDREKDLRAKRRRARAKRR